jgi:hypothetical protein
VSTKIYDGMMFESDNLTKFYKIIKQIDAEAKLIKNDLAIKLIAQKYQYYFDNKSSKEYIKNDFKRKIDENDITFFLERNYPLLNLIVELINKRCKNVINSIERDVSYDLDLCVLFAPHNKKILLFPYYEQHEYLGLLKKYFNDYGYWNNTDKPDDVSVKNWNVRRKSWNDVLDEKMLKYTLLNPSDSVISLPYSSEEYSDFANKIISNFSSLEERAAKYAQRKYIDEYVKNNQKPDSKGFESVYNAIDSLEDETVKSVIIKHKEEILSSLQEITVDTLMNYKLPE